MKFSSLREGSTAAPAQFSVVVLLATLAIVPFLFDAIPPLTDVPGHIGQYSIQLAPHGGILDRYFSFHWAPTLNLAADLVVQAMHPFLSVVATTWLLCAVTPALTVVGIACLARVENRAGAYALPWALIFVFNSSFLWGFLNFAFTQAVGLLAVAGWIASRRRPKLRIVASLISTPLLLVGHGVAGAATIAMIIGYEAWIVNLHRPSGRRSASLRAFMVVWPVVLAAGVSLVVWKATAGAHDGTTVWLPIRKLTAIIHALQDQNKPFDVASVAAALIVGALGWFWGARVRGGPAGAVVAVAALFLVAPSLLSGSDEVDTRLAPLVAMVFFTFQDWSTAPVVRRKVIAIFGFVLLGVRFAVTVTSFSGYACSYDSNLAALNYVRPGSRVLNFSFVRCDAWRSARLEHLGNLATTYRNAWVNSHWSVEGLHLLGVKYRPAPSYYNDPSEMVFPAQCVHPAVRPIANYRPAQTVIDAVRAAPLERVDYLWIIGTRLPSRYRDIRLKRVWMNDKSELYAVVHRNIRQS